MFIPPATNNNKTHRRQYDKTSSRISSDQPVQATWPPIQHDLDLHNLYIPSSPNHHRNGTNQRQTLVTELDTEYSIPGNCCLVAYIITSYTNDVQWIEYPQLGQKLYCGNAPRVRWMPRHKCSDNKHWHISQLTKSLPTLKTLSRNELSKFGPS